MPAETKPREANRAGELEDRLSTLGQQRRLAADAITAATQHVEEIVARQQQIAVAVVSEDEEAVTENEQLEEALLIENRRRATARSCGRAACSLLASFWGGWSRRGYLRGLPSGSAKTRGTRALQRRTCPSLTAWPAKLRPRRRRA